MREPVAIENIEELRRLKGIEDIELRDAIRGVAAGDFVRLTFLRSTKPPRTLLVRITSIRGPTFRGKVADELGAGEQTPRAGYPVVFTAAHIHSLAKGPTHGN